MRTKHFVYFCIKNYSGTPVVYATARSKAVVPVLFSFCADLWYILRGDSCLVLPGSLSSCFFSPFNIVITWLGKEGAGLCASLYFACVNLVFFFLFFFFFLLLLLSVRGWLRLLLVALPGHFY